MDKLRSVQELLVVAAKLPSDDYVGGWFYRGQADASWEVEPKAHRFPYNEGDTFEFKFKMWLKQAHKYPEMDFENKLEAMAIAQHHGFPTKLLDWSSNILHQRSLLVVVTLIKMERYTLTFLLSMHTWKRMC